MGDLCRNHFAAARDCSGGYDATATTVPVVLFGWLRMVVGFMQIVHVFQVRYWSGFFLYLIDGIVRTTVGVLLVLYPGSGAQALTLVLTFYFIVGGLFKTFGSIAHLILYGFAC